MPVYTFAVRRSGNLDVACSVPWQLEGTGSLPIPGSAFPGGVLPSGVADFAAGEVLAEPSFELLEGTRPALDQTGRLLLRDPVGCKIDPSADRHALTLQGENETTPDDLYEPIKLADLPASRRNDVSTLGTRTGTPGMNFVLKNDVSDSTLTLGGPGKAGQEIVFRGDSDSSAATGLRTLTNCTINIVGDFCGLARLVLRNSRVFINNRSCFVTRCEFTDYSPSKRSAAILDVDAEAKSARFSCHKNDFTDRLGPNKSCIIFQSEALEMVHAYNLIEKQQFVADGSNTYLFFYGNDADTTNIKSLLNIHHNLILDCDLSDLIEVKASDMDCHNNTIERCGAAGVRLRHGMRHKVRRNLFIDSSGAPLITVRTGPHQITENKTRTASGGAGKGNITLYAGRLHWDYEVWKDQHKPGQGNNWQASGQCTVVANDFQVLVGKPSCPTNPECYQYKAEGNNVGPSSGASRNLSVTLDHESGTKRTAVPDYNIDTVLSRMTRGAVGLRAP